MTSLMLWPASVLSECLLSYWRASASSARRGPEEAAVAPIAAAKPMMTWLQSAAEQMTNAGRGVPASDGKHAGNGRDY
ncbi:hypothetical protein [Mycobacterium lepromatosis]|uniref:hypothetical protein n=1 Tax=Mycobacterium lepromatosis TaxID=480418 RepID=UPI000A4259BF|nr:hypothetical protein [Mycobacterium lepromatosis]